MRVEVNPDLYLTAEVEFGSERPDYDDFCLGPLAAIIFACEKNGVRAHPVDNHPGVYTSVLPASGLFPPVVFTLALLDNSTVWYIHGYVVDHDYWDLIEQDPVD